jgi:predicted ATPase
MITRATPPWYVLTGGPSAGKTTLLEELGRQGYCTVPETARSYLNSELDKGRTIDEIRSDEVGLQYRLVPLKRAAEARAPRTKIVFFDRGMHDTIAYLRALGVYINYEVASDIIGASIYRKIFILDILPLISDNVRTESLTQAVRIHDLLKDSYEISEIPVVRVPVLPINQRADFVLQNL